MLEFNAASPGCWHRRPWSLRWWRCQGTPDTSYCGWLRERKDLQGRTEHNLGSFLSFFLSIGPVLPVAFTMELHYVLSVWVYYLSSLVLLDQWKPQNQTSNACLFADCKWYIKMCTSRHRVSILQMHGLSAFAFWASIYVTRLRWYWAPGK